MRYCVLKFLDIFYQLPRRLQIKFCRWMKGKNIFEMKESDPSQNELNMITESLDSEESLWVKVNWICPGCLKFENYLGKGKMKEELHFTFDL